MSNAIGPDVSFYQNAIETPEGINFVTMRSLAEYVIIRAGQNLWIDRDLKANWRDAKSAGLPRGSYWFYDSRADPKRQAELWVQALGNDLGELPMFLDLEENYKGLYTGWKNWYVCLERLKVLVGKKEIGIYTGYYYWRDHAPNALTQPKNLEYFHQYPLWMANYNVAKPNIPKPWAANEWLFWQYTSNGDGLAYGAESASIDLNYFNGTAEALRTRFHLPPYTPPTPPPPPPPPPPLPPPPPAIPLKQILSPGVTYVRDVRKTPRKLMIHVIAIDLNVSKATFLVTPPSGGSAAPLCTRTTAKFLKEFGVQIAINGDGFTYPKNIPNRCGLGSDPVKPNGFAASGGTVYNTGGGETTFYVNRKNVGTINIAPGNPLHAVSGDRLLVANGKPAKGLDATLLNPRSALGLSQNGRRLILMVVDGRQPGYSEGIYFTELAALMIYYGVYTGMNLDGGGSTSLVVQGADKQPLVLNSPIDSNVQGQQRAVANHLGLFVRK